MSHKLDTSSTDKNNDGDDDDDDDDISTCMRRHLETCPIGSIYSSGKMEIRERSEMPAGSL
jgi:hypothetical protein